MTTLAAGVERLDIEVYQGQGRTVTIPVLDGEDTPVEGPATGWAVKATVRRRPGSAALTWPDNATITASGDDDTLEVHLVFDDAVTGLWTWSEARYDVLLTPPGGEADYLAWGYIRVLPRITE